MPPSIQNFVEATDDNSPSQTMGSSLKSGKATLAYYLGDPLSGPSIGSNWFVGVDDIADSIDLFTGGPLVAISSTGGLTRLMPLAHPLMTWQYAYNVPLVQGVGQFQRVPSSSALAPFSPYPPPFVALYETYRFVVEFAPRPYLVLADAAIQNGQLSSWWTIPNAGNGNTPVQKIFVYSTEWERFTDFVMTPQQNFVTGQQGTMVFYTTGGQSPDAGGKIFPGSPRMYLPDQVLQIVWYEIPWRYLTSANSYINHTGWLGAVNQNPWPPGNVLAGATSIFPTYPAGSLLYLGWAPGRYTNPVPASSIFAQGVSSAQKLTDITLTFLYTNRVCNDAPSFVPSGNRNVVLAGHNCLPWMDDRQFHFAMSQDQSSPPNPVMSAWPSFPMEVLFTDPDSSVNSPSSFN